MAEEYGLNVSPSYALQNLLGQYPSGGQFILEALQNADDTERAKEFCALLDLRQHRSGTGGSRPCRPECPDGEEWRRRLLGPAIVFYDDGGFEDGDWDSLAEMYRSKKKNCPYKAGMYGMGSRAFFHIGDIIQIVSGSTYAVLDPDNHITVHRGERIDFVDRCFESTAGEPCSLLDAYPDECRPFMGLFGCDMCSPLKGTIFRIPLRLGPWAAESSFMPDEFSRERAEQVFEAFQETMAEGHMLLFLTGLTSLKLYRWDAGEDDMTLLTAAELVGSCAQSWQRINTQPFPAVKDFLRQFKTFAKLQSGLRFHDNSLPEVCDIVDLVSRSPAGAVSETHWMRFGQFFNDPPYLELIEKCYGVPVVVGAFPLSQACQGRIFAYLPLPVFTGLPVHFHAGFKLQDNRRGVWREAGDQEGQHRDWATWNEHIIQAVMPHVYARALELLVTHSRDDTVIYRIWPDVQKQEQGFGAVLRQLVAELALKPVLFGLDGALKRPDVAVVVDTPTDALAGLRTHLMELCQKSDLEVVDPPPHVVDLLNSVQQPVLRVMDPHALLLEAVLPRSSELRKQNPDLLAAILFAVLAWAGSKFTSAQLQDLSDDICELEWLPVVGQGAGVRVNDAFDPAATKLPDIGVVQQSQADVGKAQLGEDHLQHLLVALRACGLKDQITWEDAVAEAESIALSGSPLESSRTSTELLQHLESYHASLPGNKKKALSQLTQLSWFPARASANKVDLDDADIKNAEVKLMSASELLPEEALPLVWAVAPTLLGRAPSVLLAARSLKEEPRLLIAQLKALVTAAPAISGHPAVSRKALRHFRAVFEELLSRAGGYEEVFAEKDFDELALVPCVCADHEGAVLFRRTHAAIKAHHSQISAVVGIVHPDYHEIARKLNVPQRVPASVLVEALQEFGADRCLPHNELDVAKALAAELADRLVVAKHRPAKVLVPTRLGTLHLVEEVFIDDAEWNKSKKLHTLHPGISEQNGRALGCTSIRDELAQHCEEPSEADAFGQEADLVDQVKQLLQDYGAKGDMVQEFVQNSDDYGASELSFILSPRSHNYKATVDARAKSLQGPALYICSNKPLTTEAIQLMQQVGRSSKRLEFGSTGRFGVGLNVMYRYCDCPQLLANDCLHFFDLTRSFVARGGDRRGKKYNVSLLRENFPDSYAPFVADGVAGKYPVVFRLALRKVSSELADAVSLVQVREELRETAQQAPTMLLFVRKLTSLTFEESGGQYCVRHTASLFEEKEHDHERFWSALPGSLSDLSRQREDLNLSVWKRLTTTTADWHHNSVSDWAVAHCVQLSDDKARELVQQLHNQPHGSAVLPHGAVAAQWVPKRWGTSQSVDAGRICCCLPTPMESECAAWLHGNFIIGSARKALPLPEGRSASPTLHQQWNALLLAGPVAQALCAVLGLFQPYISREEQLPSYFNLLPSRSGSVAKAVGEAAVKAALRSCLFPVSSPWQVRWVQGPRPLFRAETHRLPAFVQDALVDDGLDIVWFPQHVWEHYVEALQQEPRILGARELTDFLKREWAKHTESVDSEVALADSGLWSLSNEQCILELLEFVIREHVRNTRSMSRSCDILRGVPLLLTHARTITSFSRIRFSSDRELLPQHAGLFVATEALEAVRVSAFAVTLPSVQALTVRDILGYRQDIEQNISKDHPYMHSSNETLRQLWRLVSNSSRRDVQEDLQEWCILPVASNATSVIPLKCAPSCVALAHLALHGAVAEKVEAALVSCGLFILDPTALELATVQMRELLLSLVVHTSDDVLKLLLLADEQGNAVQDLTAAHKHCLLVYFSNLLFSGAAAVKASIQTAKKLPLFKQANQLGSFTRLENGTTYCCINPDDPHAGALETMVPPKTALLAWPLPDTKPIYERCSVRMLSGKDFMVEFVLPHLPSCCKERSTRGQAQACLDELCAFLSESSSRVIVAAAATKFVPSEDGSTTACPKDFLNPGLEIAVIFKHVLGSCLPAGWLLENAKHLRLLHELGLPQKASSHAILQCARHVAGFTGELGAPELKMSEVLVESLAGALARRPYHEPQLEEAASWPVVAAEVHDDASIAQNVKRRATGQALTTGVRVALKPFAGTAFGSARAISWSACPCACHEGLALNDLVKGHADFMHDRLGAIVGADHVAPDLVADHLKCVLQAVHTESITVCGVLREDLEASWARCERGMASGGQQQTFGERLHRLGQTGLPCVPAWSKDKDKASLCLQPSDRCFFTIPNFTLSSCLQRFWWEVRHDCAKPYSGVFRALGVQDVPHPPDFAKLSKIVAEQHSRLRGQRMWFINDCFLACAIGFHESLKSCPRRQAHTVKDFRYHDVDGAVQPMSSLIWDPSSAASRHKDAFEQAGWHLIAPLKPTTTQGAPNRPIGSGEGPSVQVPAGEIAESLIKFAGLQKLSSVVEERRLPAPRETSDTNLAEQLDIFVKSVDCVQGLIAALKPDTPSGLSEDDKVRLRARVAELQFCDAGRSLETAWFWLACAPGSIAQVEGTARPRFFIYEGDSSIIWFSAGIFNAAEESKRVLLIDFASSFQRAMTGYTFRENVVEAILSCFFDRGSQGIAAALRDFDLEVECFTGATLRPGDEVPVELRDQLLFSMDSPFLPDDPVAVYRDSSYIFGIVTTAPVEEDTPLIQRVYAVDVSCDGTGSQLFKHMHIYALLGSTSSGSTSVSVHDGAVTQTDGVTRNPAASNIKSKELTKLKQTLHGMARMGPDEYKAAARRLYLCWHPDKAPDVPFAKEMFQLVRRHLEWFNDHSDAEKDDGWLDDSDDDSQDRALHPQGTAAAGSAERGQATSFEQHRPTAARQTAWVDEFENDLRRDREEARQAGARSSRGYVPFTPAREHSGSRGPPRIISSDESARWLQQAELEILASQKMSHRGDIRALPSHAVWHSSQAVEMALKSAMFRTCGITEEELKGKRGHDIQELAQNLQSSKAEMVGKSNQKAYEKARAWRAASPEDPAEALTEVQRAAQRNLPGSCSDWFWLTRAYLQARYPSTGSALLPGHTYGHADAERALHLARRFVHWAKQSEDLPEERGDSPSLASSRSFSPSSSVEPTPPSPRRTATAAVPSPGGAARDQQCSLPGVANSAPLTAAPPWAGEPAALPPDPQCSFQGLTPSSSSAGPPGRLCSVCLHRALDSPRFEPVASQHTAEDDDHV